MNISLRFQELQPTGVATSSHRMASCLRCVKFNLGSRFVGNSGARIVVGISENTTPRATQCVRNVAVNSPSVQVSEFY